jgi:four helix bundle protein
MTPEEMKRRTRHFGLRVIHLIQPLPRSIVNDTIARQLVKAATSVGANYRAACRARSVADFIAKLGIVEEEADESVYWLEMLTDADILPSAAVAELIEEGNEILAITVASIRTARKGR